MMEGILKFTVYQTLKWILFWGYQIFESGEKLNWNWYRVNSVESMVYTFGMLFTLPTLEIIVLSGPFYFALKQKGWVMIVTLSLIFVLEFAIGYFTTTQKLAWWMGIKLALSIGLFSLFYKNELSFGIRNRNLGRNGSI